MIQDIREQIEIGNYGRALNRIDDLLWKEPENAELRGLRGVVLVAQELNLEGIEDLGTSIALADAAEFRYWRSVALFEEKEFDKSIGYDPQNSYAYKNMGKAKLLQGLKEEALQYFLKSKELGYSEAYDAEVDDILVEDFNL